MRSSMCEQRNAYPLPRFKFVYHVPQRTIVAPVCQAVLLSIAEVGYKCLPRSGRHNSLADLCSPQLGFLHGEICMNM